MLKFNSEEITMIRNIFFDLDETLFDFTKAERIALKSTLEHFGAPSEDAVLQRYHVINIEHWKRLEKGEITRQQVKIGRYEQLFKELGFNGIDALSVTSYYEGRLAIGHFFIDGTEEMLNSLFGKYRLFLVTNGTKKVQDGRIESSGIAKFFNSIFISESVGFDKPDKRFFESCFSQIPDFSKQESIIIGDSLTSDILGGKNCGIKTAWFNKNNLENKTDIIPDYEFNNLNQIKALIEKINAEN